jgi:hypothetical protein
MSPFDAVEWAGEPGTPDSAIRVRVGESWYQLEAINECPVSELLAGIRDHYGQHSIVKRFEEDLIEAMGKLGIAAGAEATLRVRDFADGAAAGPSKVIVAEWSREKRQNLRKVALKRDSQPRDEAVTPEQTLATLAALETLIESRSAYAAASIPETPPKRWRERLADARDRVNNITTRSQLTREIRMIVAAIGDAHASVSGTDAESAGWLPFLPIALDTSKGRESPVLAVKPDRSAFIADDAPILAAIDGIPIRAWLNAASALVASASPQLVAERSCRELRDIEGMRTVVLPEALGRREVRLSLMSEDGTLTRELSLPLATTKPLYGAWPSTASRLLQSETDSPTGYIRLAEMDSESAADMLRTLQEFSSKGVSSVIVDVRGNGGGSRDALFALAGAILNPGSAPIVINAAQPLRVEGAVPEDVAEQLRRRGLKPGDDPLWNDDEQAAIAEFSKGFAPRVTLTPDRFDAWWLACVSPLAKTDSAVRWTGQVVILHDAACFSATDVFLAAMKELPRVTLIGEPSAGGSGAAREFDLPQRIKVRLSSMVSVQPTGIPFDGFGVAPDQIIQRNPRDVLNGEDRWLNLALQAANSPGAAP